MQLQNQNEERILTDKFGVPVERIVRLPAELSRGLRRQAAANYVGISKTLFDRWVAEKRLPAPTRVGGVVLWDRKQLDDAMDDMFDADVWLSDPRWDRIAV